MGCDSERTVGVNSPRRATRVPLMSKLETYARSEIGFRPIPEIPSSHKIPPPPGAVRSMSIWKAMCAHLAGIAHLDVLLSGGTAIENPTRELLLTDDSWMAPRAGKGAPLPSGCVEGEKEDALDFCANGQCDGETGNLYLRERMGGSTWGGRRNQVSDTEGVNRRGPRVYPEDAASKNRTRSAPREKREDRGRAYLGGCVFRLEMATR